MKILDKIIKISAVAAVSVIMLSYTVYAAGDIKLSADKDKCAVSDEIKVTVAADNPKDASVAPEISITFDTQRLSFKDCSCAYGGGGGGLVTLNETSADISFIVLSGGTAVVEASAVFDGDGANAKTSSVTIDVEGEDITTQNEQSQSFDLGIEGGSIQSGEGGKLVSTVFADEFMPMGFYKASITYEEQLVEAAQFDMGDIVLLYVTDENGNNGNFNVYDQSTGELSDFLQISGIENRFIIVLKADDTDEQAPEGFSLATLKWNEQTLDAYAHDGVTDFFLLYAISSEGNKGWYLYDQKDGTYQRFVNELYSGVGSNGADGSNDTEDADDSENKGKSGSFLDVKVAGMDFKLLLIIALAVIVLCLLIAVIIMGVKISDYNSYEYIDEDELDGSYGGNRQPEKIINNNRDNIRHQENNPVQAEKQESDNVKHAEPKVTASELAEREMNLEIEDIDDIAQPGGFEQPNDDSEDEYYHLKNDKKASKAEEKARKKAEKKLKKEYGEFGPANFSEWQQVVRDDRKVSEEKLLDANSLTREIPIELINSQLNETENAEKAEKPEAAANIMEGAAKTDNDQEQDNSGFAHKETVSYTMPKQHSVQKPVKETAPEPVSQRHDSYAEMMSRLPANDNNEPVQPKPVQQFDLDEDFEFEYLNLDDED